MVTIVFKLITAAKYIYIYIKESNQKEGVSNIQREDKRRTNKRLHQHLAG